ncbi:MAG TPA: hydrolase [Magnetospirillum sp.]|nr:hydrolase [Magnetospirillum sp.]
MLIEAARSVLLLVDVQENLGPVMADPRSVYRNCALLLRAAARLEIPVIASEQYPKGLGPTMGELRELLPDGAVVEKLHFSCAAEPAIAERLRGLGRSQVVVAGIEAHVCVLQTALGLKASGYDVFVAGDACSSRLAANHQAALARMAANGVDVVTTESAVFEWLHRAGTPEFKDLIALIK